MQNELSQAVLNIIVNAKDAIVQNGIKNGKVELKLSQDRGWAVINIKDNGGRIPINILPKIFDPYFTTKGESQGTGIGLYMSRKIVQEGMGGSIEATNRDGGAEFTIRLIRGKA